RAIEAVEITRLLEAGAQDDQRQDQKNRRQAVVEDAPPQGGHRWFLTSTTASPPPMRASLLKGDFAQQVDLVEGAAGAEHDGELRILADHDREPGLLAEQHVEVLEQRAAARQHDALVDDI